MSETAKEKLIRDFVPQRAAAKGNHLVTRVAELDEFDDLLRRKLLEEMSEFVAARDGSSQREELADILEVVWTLANRLGIRPFELDGMRQAKFNTHGGFSDRVVLITE